MYHIDILKIIFEIHLCNNINTRIVEKSRFCFILKNKRPWIIQLCIHLIAIKIGLYFFCQSLRKSCKKVIFVLQYNESFDLDTFILKTYLAQCRLIQKIYQKDAPFLETKYWSNPFIVFKLISKGYLIFDIQFISTLNGP